MKKSLTEVISEGAFLELVQDHSQNFLKIYNYLQGEHKASTRKFYAHLIQESEELESFLDDHSARDNKTWYYFGKLVACTRNLAKVAFILKHILNRYPAYDLDRKETSQLPGDAQGVSGFIDKTIFSLFEEVKVESLRLGIKFPQETINENFFGDIYPQKRLPYTIDEDDDLDARKIVAKLATQYLNVVEKFESFGWNCGKKNSGDLKDTIPNKVNEEKSRELIAGIHNLQSTYDHYIKRTPVELEDIRLKRFRGYISMPFHFLSLVNWLSHLHQRHVHSTRDRKGGYPISAIIDEIRLLDIIMNFALFYANRFLQVGKKLAGNLLGKYIEIDTCELKVPVKLGFHLRPSSLVAKLAKHYGTKLTLIVDGTEYDANSVLSLTMAAGMIARKGYKTVIFKGDTRVLKDLKLLAEHNYGEDVKGHQTLLPPELSHLWN